MVTWYHLLGYGSSGRWCVSNTQMHKHERIMASNASSIWITLYVEWLRAVGVRGWPRQNTRYLVLGAQSFSECYNDRRAAFPNWRRRTWQKKNMLFECNRITSSKLDALSLPTHKHRHTKTKRIHKSQKLLLFFFSSSNSTNSSTNNNNNNNALLYMFMRLR